MEIRAFAPLAQVSGWCLYGVVARGEEEKQRRGLQERHAGDARAVSGKSRDGRRKEKMYNYEYYGEDKVVKRRAQVVKYGQLFVCGGETCCPTSVFFGWPRDGYLQVNSNYQGLLESGGKHRLTAGMSHEARKPGSCGGYLRCGRHWPSSMVQDSGLARPGWTRGKRPEAKPQTGREIGSLFLFCCDCRANRCLFCP